MISISAILTASQFDVWTTNITHSLLTDYKNMNRNMGCQCSSIRCSSISKCVLQLTYYEDRLHVSTSPKSSCGAIFYKRWKSPWIYLKLVRHRTANAAFITVHKAAPCTTELGIGRSQKILGKKSTEITSMTGKNVYQKMVHGKVSHDRRMMWPCNCALSPLGHDRHRHIQCTVATVAPVSL